VKKIIAFAAAVILCGGLLSAGVVRSSKSEIVFKGFGTFTSTSTDKLTADRKWTEANSEFKGKGLLGGLAGKTFLRPGQTGDLIDLAGGTFTQIDHKRKEYTTTPLEKWAEARKQALAGQSEKPEGQQRESEIRIVRSEYKVDATGESKTINGFACRKFLATWTVDWENTRTQEKGTDRLETAVWATPLTDAFKAAQAEEQVFYQGYLKAVGLNQEKLQQDILGTEWIGLLTAFDPAGGKSKLAPDAAAVAREMKKIEGYPVVVDGKYFPAPKAKAAEAEESTGGGIGGALGRLGGSLLKKKPNPEEDKAPALSFYTELVSLSGAALDPSELQIPAGYKKK
jgi:hypothetical protein